MLVHTYPRFLFIILSVFSVLITSYADDKQIVEYLFLISDSLENKIHSRQPDSTYTVLKQALSLTAESQITPVFPKSIANLSGWFLLRTKKVDLIQLTAQQKYNGVLHLQKNNSFHIHTFQPNDPLYDEQWYHKRLNAVQAWEHFTVDPDIILAVIDTGIDYNHPDLTQSIWINSKEDLNANGMFDSEDINFLDDDNNGYIDDVMGWDFTDAPSFADGGDYIDPDNDPMDEYPGGHGTKIAGLIAASTNNQIGIAALLPGSRVMNLRAGTSSGYLEEDDVAQAVLYAVNNGARIINMSFGDVVLSKFLKDVIDYAYSNDVVIIASAGNSGTDQINYPAGLTQTISVGASDIDDNLAGFSNWGQSIDLVAPGVNILMPRLGGGYESSSGTSFSAPMVAATTAIILSKNSDYNVEQVRNILKTSSDDIGQTGWDVYFGAGRLNMLTTSQTDKQSSVHIIDPSSEKTESADSVAVIVTVQDPDLLSINLFYGFEDNPDKWYTLIADYPYQVIEDTLTYFYIGDFPDTTLILRLQLKTWNGEISESRSYLTIDRSYPQILNHTFLTILEDYRYAALIEFETDDITSANLYYREKNSTGPFEIINLDYQAQQHSCLFMHAGRFEYYLQVVNLSGLQTFDTNNDQNYTIVVPKLDLGGDEFLPLSRSLPAGYMLSNPTDFDRDGNFEIVLSRYDASGSFGPVEIYEFNGTDFVKQMATSFNAIPRDFGDTDGDDLEELLLGYGQNSYILEASEPNGWPSALVWEDSMDFWISRISDLDKDGIAEIVGKQGEQFVLLESSGNNIFTKIAEFPNPSTGENQLGPPRTAIADLDLDGFQELYYGDYDGDLIVYENAGDNYFELRSYIPLKLQDATDHFTSGKLFHESGEFLIAGTHKGSDNDNEHDFGSRYWIYTLIRGTANDTFTPVEDIAINGFSGLKEFDSGINVGRILPDSSTYLFLAPYPDLYLFKTDGDSIQPFSYIKGVNTNTVIIYDFDSDGNTEFYINTGEKIIGYEKSGQNRPPVPLRVQATPLDTNKIILEWDGVLTADRFVIFRGLELDNLIPYDSVNSQLYYTDTSLIKGTKYYYAVQTVNQDFEYSRSRLSQIVNAVPNSRPQVVSLLVKNEHQIELYFNETMDQSSLQPNNFKCDPSVNRISSVIPFLNGKAVLISFQDLFSEGETVQLELISVRDSNRTALKDEDKFQFFTYIQQQTGKPYVREWHFVGSHTLILRFNTAMNLGSVLNSENYKLEPRGNVLTVEMADSSKNQYRLKLSADTYGPSSGVTTYIVLNNIKSENGTALEEGNRIALVSAPLDINNLVVYPQPVTPDFDWLMFSNIAPETSVKIFDLNGHLVCSIEEKDKNGGVRWNLRDQSGKPVSAGIYIYLATYKDQQKLGKFTIIK